MLDINNQTDYHISNDDITVFQSVVNEVLHIENKPENLEVSICFVSPKTICELNHHYRNQNQVTDVLSFPQTDKAEPLIEFQNLGDIVICLEQAIHQAALYEHSLLREICFLIAHSMLHLLHYDHNNEKDEKIMIDKQNAVLERLQIRR